MKIFSFLFAAVFANPMNLLIMNEVLNDDDTSDNNDMLMLMLMSPGLLGGNPMQAEQMNPLLPLILLDDKDNNDNGKLFLLKPFSTQDMSIFIIWNFKTTLWCLWC